MLKNLFNRKPQIDIQSRIDEIGVSIAGKRDDAVKERKSSGIEKIWMACEEAYLGIDESNRHEFEGAKWAKPTSMEGPVTTDSTNRSEGKSTAFVRLTSRYVDAASAKISEITLPIDDKPFAITPTPVPELIAGLDDMRKVLHGDGAPLMRDISPEETPQQQQPAPTGQPQQAPITVKDLAKENMDMATDSAKKAELRIYDWMIECAYPREMRKVIHDSARIGTGILKGPFPESRKEQALSTQQNVIALEIVEKVAPAVKRVSAWNIYPDPACGEDIHDGDYIFEKDMLSPKKLRDLKKNKKYISRAIDKVIEEGPNKSSVHGEKTEKGNKRFAVWYYYGTLNKDDADLFGIKGIPDDAKECFAIVTLVNDTVIRCSLNPLDSGKFPYHVLPWTRRDGSWTGVGVAEQVSMPQKMVNAATRAMLNNAGKAAGSQIVIDQGMIEPADGQWILTPDKIWYKSADAVMDDVRKAFAMFETPNMQQPLMNIINYGFKQAEDASAIPLVTQGQQGETSPQTFGQAELQNTNAHTLLRSIGNTLDDCITEPVVKMFYEWLLLDPDVPQEEKGDFNINAHGSINMVEKSIQEFLLLQIGQLALNPVYGIDPKKWMEMMLKSKRLDPRDVIYSDEQLQQMSQQQPQQAPSSIMATARVQAAQIAAQARTQVAQMENQTEQQKIAHQVDKDGAFVHMEMNREQAADNYNMQKLQVERELAMLQYANANKMNLDTVKAQLAAKEMALNTEKQLAAAANQMELATQAHQHVHETNVAALEPAVQVPGRAGNGHALDQTA